MDRAVITVPANFNDLQRAATKTAGRLAGLDVSRILNEPTAAALAYGAQGKQERVAVYDLGGGTFDVTILDLVGNVFEVLATAGDTALGGDDIDAVIADRMADDLIKTQRFDARAAPSGLARLRILGEEMKRELSVRSEHAVVLRDFVPAERGVAVTWRHRMTRPELEWAALPIVERTLKVCEGALAAAGVDAGAIDRVILVGGATRMPMVARKVEQFFGRAPVVSINPDEVVALGAAIQARLLERGGARARTQGAGGLVQSEEPGVAALSAPRAPVEAADVPDLPVVTAAAPALEADRPKGKPPTLPSERNAGTGVQQFLPRAGAKPLVFDTTASVTTPDGGGGRAPPRSHPALSPRAAASKHPNEPAGESRRRPLLIDVTPLSLAVETVGGFCDILIEANTPVPCDRTRSFATASDGQTVVRVRVSQGESRSFADNTFLGEVELSDIAPAPRGQAPIAVTFEIDADGILNVRARDVNTARETAAKMNLVGAQTDPGAMDAMRKRQAAHPLAAPAGR